VRADVLNAGKLTIGNLQLLIRCRELNTITDRKLLLLSSINGDAHLTAWIVGCLLTVAAQNRKQILLAVDSENTRILSFADAGLLRCPRIMQYVVGLIPLCPTAIRAG